MMESPEDFAVRKAKIMSVTVLLQEAIKQLGESPSFVPSCKILETALLVLKKD